MKRSPPNSEILCVNQTDRDLKKSRKQQFYLRTSSRCKYLPNIFCHNVFQKIFGARLTWQDSTRPLNILCITYWAWAQSIIFLRGFLEFPISGKWGLGCRISGAKWVDEGGTHWPLKRQEGTTSTRCSMLIGRTRRNVSSAKLIDWQVLILT